VTLPLEGGLRRAEEISERLERELIERAIRLHPRKSNTELAELLGTSRRVLESRLRRFGIGKKGTHTPE
jgi:DNA-binding NtrC family response regulator